MTDERFRLTSIDVKHEVFKTSRFGGYDRDSVEDFRSRVAEALEQLTRENQELESKARNFHEQLRAFRERDKALNEALVSAQQLRAETREQAERESQLILREARAEAERMVDAARAEIRKLETELSQLERSRRAYVGQLRAVIERQLAEIDAADAATAPRAEPDDDDPRHTKKTPAWLDSLIKE